MLFPRKEVPRYSRDQGLESGTLNVGDFAVREEPNGLSVFPNYTGRIQTNIIPELIDEEEELAKATQLAKDAAEEAERKVEIKAAAERSSPNKQGSTQFRPGSFGRDLLWMPDKICKVCYNCEDPFNLYRRRHHCRMCGQVFCDRCSSEYVDGLQVPGLGPGLHRACGLCHDLYCIQAEKETKPHTKRLASTENGSSAAAEMAQTLAEHSEDSAQRHQDEKEHRRHSMKSSKPPDLHLKPEQDRSQYNKDLQHRASAHLDAIIQNLVDSSILEKETECAADWKETISNLVREVVGNVDPDVRSGDSMDIRPYIKLKIIAGGKREECAYVDGVVFRKNVSHKKMLDNSDKIKHNPKILILGGGIEFQRTDTRLSTMDTLIEQEDQYISILVDKIMFLCPDLILVGKAVSRRAQELLCEHNVAVVQNIRADQLERISRVTGALTLPSTDHMIQHYGEECLGTCGRFLIKAIRDDPEHQLVYSQANRVLKNSIARGATHIYLDGCPPELGCTVILRGAERPVLEAVKNIVRFSIVAAYHLRLEVAYYNDRDLYIIPQSISAVEDEYLSEDDGLTLGDDVAHIEEKSHLILGDRKKRLLLSTSLDVDIGLPYCREIRGLNTAKKSGAYRRNMKKVALSDHQTLLFNSLAMNENKTPRGKTELLRIGYYAGEDITLGQFLIENCFHLSLHKHAGRDSGMLDQVLSFTHRFGRINISVVKEGNSSSQQTSNSQKQSAEEEEVLALPGKLKSSKDTNAPGSEAPAQDPFYLPIVMASYCKECKKFITQNLTMSDETWKMSFGKFMEITFYNRTAKPRNSSCPHDTRDDHELHQSAEEEEVLALPGKLKSSKDTNAPGSEAPAQDPFYLPIVMASYCKECKKFITQNLTMSDETWKMSFGKFMEITFYNRTAKPRDSSCPHDTRDDHELHFSCEGFCAKFEFVPFHAFSLHVRAGMPFPEEFHQQHRATTLRELPAQIYQLVNIFKTAISEVRTQAKQVLRVRGGGLGLDTGPILETVIGTLDALQADMAQFLEIYIREVNQTIEMLPPQYITKKAKVSLFSRTKEGANDEVIPTGDSVAPVMNTQTTPVDKEDSESARSSEVTDHRDDSFHTAHGEDTRKSEDTRQRGDSIYQYEAWRAEAMSAMRNSSSAQDKEAGSIPSPSKIAPVTVTSQASSAMPSAAPSPVRQASSDNMSVLDKNIQKFRLFFPKHHMKVAYGRATYWNVQISQLQNLLTQVHNELTQKANASPANRPVSYKDADVEQSVTASSSPSRDASTSRDKDRTLSAEFVSSDIRDVEASGDNRPQSARSLINDDDESVMSESSLGRSRTLDASFDDAASNALPAHSLINAKSSNRGLANVLARLIAGGENDDGTLPKLVVPLEKTSVGVGHLGLPAGRRGEVISVHEEFLASIIAYSLSSEDYYDKLKKVLYAPGSHAPEFSATSSPRSNANMNVSQTASAIPTGSNESATRIDEETDENTHKPDPVRASENSVYGMNYAEYLFNQAQSKVSPEFVMIEEPDKTAVEERVSAEVCSLNEGLLVSQRVSHVKHRFDDVGQDGTVKCKFQCVSHWALQFEAMRAGYFRDEEQGYHTCSQADTDAEDNLDTKYFDMAPKSTGTDEYIQSLALSATWSTQGGKSGASFSKSLDGRFVCKVISLLELNMFIDYAPAYFEYMANAFYRDLPTVLCKILGVYTISYERKGDRRLTQNVVVMENIFHDRAINKTFDLKGSQRARYMEVKERLERFDENLHKRRKARKAGKNHKANTTASEILLDDNLLELTDGRPFPLKHRAKIFFDKAVTNDTEFLGVVNVVDYSMLVGFDENTHEIVVGIIDYIRQYDLSKKFERLGKSVGMIAGQAEPTIIQPIQYCRRFNMAMERYFMSVPDHWSFSEDKQITRKTQKEKVPAEKLPTEG